MSIGSDDRAVAPRPVGNARAMLARHSEKWNAPLSAGIEISDRCNEVCVHCYQEQGRKGEMTTEELIRVMDELASMGVLLLTFSGGEATLRKDFLQLVAYARHKGFAVRIFTNGLTMTPELARALGELAVQMVEISLYSTHPDTHDFVTGVRGSFAKTVAGVRNLVEVGVSVTIKTPVMSINEHELTEYAAFAASLGAVHSLDVGALMPREGESRAPEAFQVSGARRVEIRREHVPAPAAAIPSARRMDTAPCSAAKSIHIEPNGELRPCTMLDFGLGHALREGVAAAHAFNERALEVRQLTWANLHGCRDCDLRAYCSHCYASALSQTGDALGPYASACEYAAEVYGAAIGRAPQFVEGGQRAANVGPYREITEGVLELVADLVTAEDDALAAGLGWARRAEGAVPAPTARARPGELVQIRRPGRKKSQLERIPMMTTPNSTVEVARENFESEGRSNASLTEA